MPTVWLNGKFVDEAEASVSLRDTGLLHAAGVFTTMRSYGGKVVRAIADHLRRLRDSCEALFIPLQYKDDAAGAAAAEAARRATSSPTRRLRLTVTRGTATPGPAARHAARADRLPHGAPSSSRTRAEYYQRGLTVMLLDEQKLNPYDLQAGHKTLNYFSRLAALREANRRGAGEALWFNVHNYLQSGSISNVFIVKDGALVTPADRRRAARPGRRRGDGLPEVGGAARRHARRR